MSYIISVNSDNPEFPVDKREMNGIECGGYLLVCFKDNGDPISEALNGVSTLSLSKYIASDIGSVCNIIRQACAVADGLISANAIKKEYDKNNKEILLDDFMNIISDIRKKLEEDRENNDE